MSKDKPAEQAALLQLHYKRKLIVVELDSLPSDKKIVGPPPSARFSASVAKGLRKPIDITEEPDGSWYLLDGGRRVKAARMAGHSKIEAIHVMGLTDPLERQQWSIAVNSLRSENPFLDALAIRGLAKKGQTEKEIALALGLTAAEVKRLGPLNALPTTLWNAGQNGQIALGIALQVAKLPAQRQERLADLFKANKELKGTDLHDAREARSLEAQNDLHLPAMDMPENPAAELYVICLNGDFVQHAPLSLAEARAYLGRHGAQKPNQYQLYRLLPVSESTL